LVEQASKAQTILPGVSLYSSITPDGVKKELGGTAAMAGGAIASAIAGNVIAETHLNPIHYLLLVTVVTVILGGVIVTYHRSKNVPEQRDDAPPEPGILRKPDQAGNK